MVDIGRVFINVDIPFFEMILQVFDFAIQTSPFSTLQRGCISHPDFFLDGMTVWHLAICDIFDERRAAPPAYGRRAWSKVVSYLMVFRYVIRFW